MLKRCKRSLSMIRDLSKKGKEKSGKDSPQTPGTPESELDQWECRSAAEESEERSNRRAPEEEEEEAGEEDCSPPLSFSLSSSSSAQLQFSIGGDGDDADANNNCPEVREFLGLDNQGNGQQQQQQQQQQHHHRQHHHHHHQELQQQRTKCQSPSKALERHPHSDSKMNGDNSTRAVNLGPTEKPSALLSNFHFLKVIGKGSFGQVYLAKHKQEGHIFAVKVLRKAAIMKRNEAQHIMSERNVLVKTVRHPFLVGLRYSLQTSDKLYFFLDYVNGGELFFHLQRDRSFSEPRAKFYAAEIASALGYLHSEDILYRDLKPENILLDSVGHVVLTDFGLCKEGITGEATTSTFCGTPEYLAPEVLRKQPYDKTVDWWCLGAVLFEMINGLPPFYDSNTSEMYNNILYKPLTFRAPTSPECQIILKQLLHKDKRKRLGASRDLEELQQTDFFADINWQDLYDRKVPPPYNPNVSGQLDLRHFDQEFVREPVPSSVGRSGGSSGGRMISASVMEANAAFDGFSYVPPADEAFGL